MNIHVHSFITFINNNNEVKHDELYIYKWHAIGWLHSGIIPSPFIIISFLCDCFFNSINKKIYSPNVTINGLLFTSGLGYGPGEGPGAGSGAQGILFNNYYFIILILIIINQ